MAGKHPAVPGGNGAKPEKNIPIRESGKQNRGNGYTQGESIGTFISELYLLVPKDYKHSKSSAQARILKMLFFNPNWATAR